MAFDLDNEELKATRILNGVDRKEKTADEMFEELGFRREAVEHTLTGEIVTFVHQYRMFDGNYDETISFNNSTKLMWYENLLFNKPSINIFEPRLLQAINKKCEELNWI